MKPLIIILFVVSLIGCNHHIYFHKDNGIVQDTLIIRDTVVPSVIIIRDTIIPDTVMITQKILEMPLNPWPGMILPFDNVRSDTVDRVWLQWGENGQWHQYILNDTCR